MEWVVLVFYKLRGGEMAVLFCSVLFCLKYLGI